VGKTIEVLTKISPGITRMAVLWNPDAAIGERRAQVLAAVTPFGITPLVIEVRDRDAIEGAFVAMRKQRANALFVITDPLTLQNRNEIVRLAASYHLPAVYEFSEFARAGGLVAYAPSIADQFRRAAVYVDKILRGMKPSELPIEQPTRFELVINQKTAKALGIAVPKMLLRADEVLQ
jgi:putative ABC transport system substrate-binding protein